MENRTSPPAHKNGIEIQLRFFRERMAAGIALLIVSASFIIIGIAMTLVSKPEQFALAKDLLLFINPILGVAIGYFFNKVTSDARAETAEKAADVASNTAQQANEARSQAVNETETMRTQAAEMKGVLHDLVNCTEDMIAQSEAPKGPRTLSAERGIDSNAPSTEALRSKMALEAALTRAQKWMNQ